MTTWTNKYIRPNKYSRPMTKLKSVRKIVVHWTANFGATAANHFNYFNNLKGRYASAHIFVDKDESLCIIPLNEVSYHANDGTYRGISGLKPNANLYSIGVELCVERDGIFHPNTIARAEKDVAELCKMYNLNPIEDVVRHYDITHKNCPAPWVKDQAEFIKFKNNVRELLNPKPPTPPTPQGVYWDGVEMRQGQIGRLTILKPINLWKDNAEGKLEMVRILQPSEVYRVYGARDEYGGQLNVGGGCWVTRIPEYILYETPSKSKLQEAEDYYKNN